MKNDLSLLIRHYLKGQGGVGKLLGFGSVKHKAAKVGIALLAIYLAVVFGFMMFSSAMSQALLGGERFVFTVFLYTLMLPLIFLTPIAIGLFQGGRDIDMLLSWPIRKKDIWLSRFMVLMIWVVPFSLVVYVPMVILSFMLFGFAPLWLISYTLMHAATVMLCCILLGALTINLPKQAVQWATSIVSVAIMFMMLKSSGAVLENGIPEIRLPSPSPWLSLIILAVSAAVCAILWPSCSKRIGTRVPDITLGKKKNVRQKSGTPVRALMKGELMQIRGESGLMSEFIMELIIPVFLILIYSMMGIAGDLFEMMSGIPEHVRLLLPAFLVGGTCTINMLSSTTFSREGRMSDVYRALPIKRSDRIKAKVGLHILAELPSIIVCTVVFSVLFRTGATMTVMTLIWCLLLTLMTSLFGVNIDMRNPQRNWEKRVDALKKNFNGMKAMFLSFIAGAVSIVPWVIMKLSPMLSIGLAIVTTLPMIAIGIAMIGKCRVEL